MVITYWHHSGFSIRTSTRLLIFDYIKGCLCAPEKGDNAVAFVSHSHADHFAPFIEQWRDEGRLSLIASEDVVSGGKTMKPGDVLQLGDMTVEAFGSTDLGVSFLIHIDDKAIFHAGDLNFWHWRNESTAEEIKEAQDAFERVLDSLSGQKIDLAFFPVDPRMGSGYDEGARMFIERIAPKRLVPMHFSDSIEAAKAFEADMAQSGAQTIVKALTKPGESFTL